jgi:Skp family chaperone for outer membrane proteins
VVVLPAPNAVEAATPGATVPQEVFNGVSINVPVVGTITATDATISFTKGVTITSVLPSASASQVKDSGAAILQELQAGEAPESDEARAERLRSQGGTREAVIDMAHVFENDPEYQRLRTEMVREVEAADAKYKAEAKQLAIPGKPPEALSGEEAKALQLELLKRRTQFELEIKMVREKMAHNESEIILTTYRRIRKAIAAHAKENGIHIVRRASMQSEQERQLNSGDPMAVRQVMSNEVVYVADDTLDITEEVIARLKAESAPKANVSPDPAVNNTEPVLN